MAAWAVVMYALMFVHLLADFPRTAPWSDMSKCTDEGWYGGGALHHFVFGHWYLPFSFNPTVAMPMWPLMLGGWFSVAGVGMLQARILAVLLYGVSLALFVVLLREAGCRWVTCAAAVLLMTANPFCYVFDRMALLEPVAVFWWMAGMWLAARAARGEWWRALMVGVAIVALVLTKTTAVALLPSILFFLYARAKQERVAWGRPLVVAVGTAIVLWGLYFFVWVRPRYLKDFRFVFAINNYRSHLTVVARVLTEALADGLWINTVLVLLAVVLWLIAAVRLRQLWRSPLFTAMLVALIGHFAFIVYHGNLQPRYYLILTIPVVSVVVMTGEALWFKGMRRMAVLTAAVLIAIAAQMTVTTLSYVRHPAYTYRDMATAVAEKMRSGGQVAPVIFAAAGDDISLFTGVRAISMYEPYGLQPLLDRYRPGWMGAWQDWEQAFPKQVASQYELQPVETFRVYNDQPHHGIFVLYKMTPRAVVAATPTK